MDIKEKRFEQDIESYMLNYGGYTKGDLSTYNRETAIDLPKLIQYIKATQPKEWQKYERNYGADAEKRLYKRFQECVDTFGLTYVLKHGFEDRGAKIKIVSFKENTTLNDSVLADYNSNIVTCTRQFKYSTENENSIDMVLSVNGIPVVALELKDQLTWQSVANAKKQFMTDRNPKEFCFRFDNRFLVYFAVDLYEVAMTTKLDGEKTFFLPFNQGSNGAGNVGGKGNPENKNGYATSYLWEKVLTKDSLLNILQRFLQRVEEEKIVYSNGKEVKKKSVKLIFPRFHQLDVVSKLVADVKDNGSGHNYLIQHSAGSGKSNSIAWLAYQLTELHDKDNKPIFTSVIVVNDRTVLDRQTQNTIYGFDHTKGVVEKIDDDKHSADLKAAINNGKKIIITTIQKFPYIYNEIDDTTDRRFAIIVDEAHNSQTGKNAAKLKTALADTEDALREYAELEGLAEDEVKDQEDKLVDEMLSHGKHKNLSFFAFTATPKSKTLEIFGTPRENGKGFRPFHIYSMKQAIEEGFILDVLKNFMHYKTCYRIAKQTPDNPEVPANKAVKAVLRYKELHPHNIAQKTAIIIETYRSVTKNKINGRAKAMVVTASRLHAIRYYHEMKRYIESHGYDDVEILIAFSGVVKDGEFEYTEEGLNKRKDGTTIKESQLPSEFNKDEYAMLVVAEKYQTGFDEPLLHTMFVDKKLKDVKAVQTLSRLNRICPGKTDTFVLDFVNTAEDIQKAFEPYYEATYLDEEINVNMIYDTRQLLRQKGIYDENDIQEFLKIFLKKDQNDSDLGTLTSLLKPVVARYEAMSEEDRFEVKKTVKNFNKWYSYITQISRMFDRSLQEEYTYTQYLEKMLPPVSDTRSVDLEDKLKLEYYKIQEDFHGDISLAPTESTKTLENPKSLKTAGFISEEDALLEEIISKINERFDGIFSEGDRVIVETLYNRAKENKKLNRQAQKNDEEVYTKSIFPEVFKQVAQDCYMEQMKAFSKLFEDKRFYDTVMAALAQETYRHSNEHAV